MARYVIASGREWWEADASACLAQTVHEPERRPTDTGLLDRSGSKIYRVEDQPRIGFWPSGATKD